MREADALTLQASALAGGTINVETVNGALTVLSADGNGITLAANGAGGDVTVNGEVRTDAAVAITANGRIVGTDQTTVDADTLSMNASSIGSADLRFHTQVSRLNATARTGGIYIEQDNGLRRLDAQAATDIEVTERGRHSSRR